MKALLALVFLFPCLPLPALEEFEGVVWVDHPDNTASAFRVRAGDLAFKLHLYFVEAPDPGNGERNEAMARFFGVTDPTALAAAGQAARAATRAKLARPFRVHIRRRPAAGEETLGFVTAGRADLAAYLARAGHARVHGTGRDSPRSIPREEMSAILHDAMDAAKLERAGVWALSDPVRLPALRAEARQLGEPFPARFPEDAPAAPAVPEVRIPPLDSPVNVNTADIEELTRLPGVDDTLAGRIIRGRPYRVNNDLLDVRGIGVNLLESWGEQVTTR